MQLCPLRQLLALSALSGTMLMAEALPSQFEFKLPQRTTFQVQAQPAEDRLTRGERLPWLRAIALNNSGGTMDFGSRVVLQTQTPEDLAWLLRDSLLVKSRTIAPDLFILQAPDALTAMREAHRLAQLNQVRVCYPVMSRAARLNWPYAPKPTDSDFASQWQLENRASDGHPQGVDLNIRSAWPYTRGDGVTIAVADTGIELTHQELASRAAGEPHFNFVLQTTNGTPPGSSANWAHGTEAAGLIAAQRNNARLVGVAPEAKLASWVIFDTNLNLASDEQLMDMFQYQSNTVAVQNHSWNTTEIVQGGPTLLEQVGLSNAFQFGRAGKGTIMMRAGGNGRVSGANGNDDAYISDPRSIAVAAVRADGRVASYSEPGACLLVAAPSGDSGLSGLFTTDLLGTRGINQFNFFPPNEDLSDYAFNSLGFSGTSASAPQIAGIAALLLSANPNLTIRDVQQILVLSARQYDFADPDLTTNGAGFLVSHNLGFGVPDAGEAVRLAIAWSNRPPQINVTMTRTNFMAIPDDGLRVEVSGSEVPPTLASIQTLPDTGIQPDMPTASLPLVNVGQAAGPVSLNLTNKGALIIRGGANFDVKIQNAARAGAAFAVVYNYPTNTTGSGAPGGDQLIPMGPTDFVTIPAVFIGNSAGQALSALCQTNASVRARIRLFDTNCVFTVTNALLCEHVALRVQTDHPLRGDLRITLVSPQGTRSILQRYNADTNAGPVDWTYYSTHHFYESSVGDWTVHFGDEAAGNVGNVLHVSLVLYGIEIIDTDHDGLDDRWEMAHFGNLAQGPRDDPDQDGYSNMREQIMGTDPRAPNAPFQLDLSQWNQTMVRLSWPGRPGYQYEVWGGTSITQLTRLDTLPARWPETEWFTATNNLNRQFYQVIGHEAP